MSPNLPRKNFANHGLIDSKFISYFLLYKSLPSHSSYFEYFFFGQFCALKLFANCHMTSSFQNHISRIFFMSSRKKMLWVKTLRYITMMTNVKISPKRSSKKNIRRHSMHKKCFSLSFFSEANRPISSFVSQGTSPKPTARFHNLSVFYKPFTNSFFFLNKQFRISFCKAFHLVSTKVVHVTKFSCPDFPFTAGNGAYHGIDGREILPTFQLISFLFIL